MKDRFDFDAFDAEMQRALDENEIPTEPEEDDDR